MSARVKLVYRMGHLRPSLGEAELEGPSLQAQGLAIPEEAVVAMALWTSPGMRSQSRPGDRQDPGQSNTNPTIRGCIP